MTIKEVHFAIKKGISPEELVAKYGFESQEELFDSIRKMTPKGSKSLIAALKKNYKKHSTQKPEDSQQVKNEKVPLNDETYIATAEYESIYSQNNNQKPEMLLKELLAEEAELSVYVRSLEGSHKDLMARRRTITDELGTIKIKCEKMLEELGELEQKARNLKCEYDKIAAEMADTNDEIACDRELLLEIRNKIEGLKRVSIFIYEGGTIEFDGVGVEIPVISEEKINILFNILLSYAEAEECTIKELKAISKVALISRKLSKFELMFENPIFQQLFEIAIATA